MAKAKKTKPPLTYTVVRDTREQQGWQFPVSDRCLGTVPGTLKTGDYSLAGYEDRFVIERKGSAAEFAQNVFQARFHRELDRLDRFAHAYVFLEFTFEEVVGFPVNSGIPPSRWKRLRTTPQLFLCKLHELQLAHPTVRFWAVGARGREVASSLFKRIVERHV